MLACRMNELALLALASGFFGLVLETPSAVASETHISSLVVEVGPGDVGIGRLAAETNTERLRVENPDSEVRVGLTSEPQAIPQVNAFFTNRLQVQSSGPKPSIRLVTGGSVRLAASSGSVTSDRGRAEGLFMDFRAVEVGTFPLGFPLSGARMSSGFGMRGHPILGGHRMHSGVDLAAATGTPVRATSSGVVSKAEWFGSYGLFVAVNHGGGLQTRYGHMSRLNVVEGQSVRKGEIIGFVGSTGRSTGPHLHYEVRLNGSAVNPLGLPTFVPKASIQVAASPNGALAK